MSRLQDLLDQHQLCELMDAYSHVSQDVLLETVPTQQIAEHQKAAFTAVLRDLGVTQLFGCYIQRCPTIGWSVYLGRHDQPKTAPMAIRRRIFGPVQIRHSL